MTTRRGDDIAALFRDVEAAYHLNNRVVIDEVGFEEPELAPDHSFREYFFLLSDTKALYHQALRAPVIRRHVRHVFCLLRDAQSEQYALVVHFYAEPERFDYIAHPT